MSTHRGILIYGAAVSLIADLDSRIRGVLDYIVCYMWIGIPEYTPPENPKKIQTQF